MGTRITQLHCKEVICIGSGQRLGFISDVEIDVPEGHVLAIVVPGPCRFLGMLGRNDDFVIPWKCIKKIGPDIVLVDIRPNECLFPRPKPGWMP